MSGFYGKSQRTKHKGQHRQEELGRILRQVCTLHTHSQHSVQERHSLVGIPYAAVLARLLGNLQYKSTEINDEMGMMIYYWCSNFRGYAMVESAAREEPAVPLLRAFRSLQVVHPRQAPP